MGIFSDKECCGQEKVERSGWARLGVNTVSIGPIYNNLFVHADNKVRSWSTRLGPMTVKWLSLPSFQSRMLLSNIFLVFVVRTNLAKTDVCKGV